MKFGVLAVCALFGAAFATEELRVIPLNGEVTCAQKSAKGDLISVHYTGKLEDGTVFDSSLTRGTPISFTLGAGQVIQGWDQGLFDMCIGEKRRLVIPPHLGYGSRGAGGVIPPNAVLVFDTELVSVKGKEKDEL